MRNIHGAVHKAFKTAIKWGLLKTNPASEFDLPPAPKREALALDFSQTRSLLQSSSEHWLGDFVVLDASCGVRRGELLSLTWPDVDIESGTILISKSLEQTKKGLRVKETKGRKSRTIPLPQDAIEALQRVKASQNESRQIFGPDYRTDLDLVFCHPDGSFIRPDTVTKAVRRIAKKVGLAGVSLHTLRHSHGSQLLSAGVPLPAVSNDWGMPTST